MKNQVWQEIEFGDSEYFEVKKGESITKDKVTEGKIPVVAGGQQPAYYHNKSNRPGETITISGSGAYAGFVNYFKEPIFASDCSTVQTKNELISSKYAYLFLKSYQSKIYSMQKGIAQPHVYPKDIIKIKISLPFKDGKPDLKEQERIVSILEKAEKQKERGKYVESLLNEYLNAIFNEMFCNKGFKIIKLKEMCNVITKGTTPTTYGYSFVSQGINFIKIENIDEEGNLILNSINYISKEAHEALRRSQLCSGDILFSIAGALGRIAIITREHLPANINQAISIIRLSSEKEVNKEYLRYYLRSDAILKQIDNNKRGVAQLNLNLEQVGNLNIILPPLLLQHKFTKIVEQIEKIKENVKKTKGNSEELFNSLMSKAFRGELKI